MTAVTFRVLALSLAAFAGIAAGRAHVSLYDLLGGQDGVAHIANTLIDRVATDPSLKRSFEGSNLRRIKTLLAEQICDLSGGPCHYSGDPMKEAHAGHHISEAEFYGMVAALRDVLKADHVGQGASNELLALLAPMKRDIVEPASGQAK
ncbi:MAG TPA: group 1 truncated hemoglobin [Steroidobacteraceae bacterium]|jgi:hemoglobin|nr:group 1 truncated hemoglobin [Steroidobacteraceae bacterium]